MSDEPAQVRVTIPQCPGSPFLLNPTPAVPATLHVCQAAEWQFLGLPPVDGYQITVERLGSSVPSLHVLFKNSDPPDSSDDAFTVLPRNRLGSSYRAIGQRGHPDVVYPSRWVAVAALDLELNYANCNNDPRTRLMSTHQLYQDGCGPLEPFPDGTGFQVRSTGGQPFALITGHTCATVPPISGACDTLMEMMPPESWSGTEYLVTEFNKHHSDGLPGDLVRIVAVDGGAVGTIDVVAGGVSQTDNFSFHQCLTNTTFNLVNPGDWCDVSVKGGARVATTSGSGKRILVGHFMKGNSETGTGDPSFALVVPTSRMRCGHRFFSFEGFPYDPADLDGTYVNIVAASSALPGIRLDGQPLSNGVTCIGYSKVDFPGMTHSWTKCRLADPPAGGQQHLIEGLAGGTGTNLVAGYAYGQQRCPEPCIDNEVRAYAYPTGFGF